MYFSDNMFPSTHFLAISSSNCTGYLHNLNDYMSDVINDPLCAQCRMQLQIWLILASGGSEVAPCFLESVENEESFKAHLPVQNQKSLSICLSVSLNSLRLNS